MGRPLRVAIDVTSLHDVRTGVGRFVQEVLPVVGARDDVDVRAFAVTLRGRRLPELLPPGVQPRQRWPMAARPLRAIWQRSDLGRIERWTGPVDVVHGPNFVVPPARAAQVVTIHDLTFLHHPELCTADVLRYPRLVDRALRRGAWVHTPSQFVREEVIRLLGADPARVVAVPNGVTVPPDADPSRGRALAGTERFVLALGTVEPRKDLPTLVAAFDRLAGTDPALGLVLAGPDGWGTAQLDAAVARARHGHRVRRLGFVPETDRGDLLAAAAVVAVPSLYEGFGLAAAEAMATGSPVVASDAGSHPEVIGDAGLLVAPRDPEALADALARVLADDALASELVGRGRTRAAGLTWARTAEGLVDLWQQAARST